MTAAGWGAADWVGNHRRAISADVAFLAGLCAVEAVRWLIMADTPVVSGADPGNWLAYGHALFGERIRSATDVYPPLIPFLCIVTTTTLGISSGLRFLDVLSASLAAGAVYVVLRAYGNRWFAVVGALLIAVAASTGEAMAWGGYPQLLGLGLLVLTLAVLDAYLRNLDLRLAAGAALLLASALGSGELLGGATVVAALILLLLRAVSLRHTLLRAPFRIAGGLGMLAAAVIVYVPLYLTMLDELLRTHGVVVAPSAAPNVWPGWSELLDPEFPGLWRWLFALGLAAPLVCAAVRRTPLWFITTSIGLSGALCLLLLSESRFIYLLPVEAVLSAGLVIDALLQRPGRVFSLVGATLAITLACALPIEGAAGLDTYREQVGFYTVLTPPILQSLQWIEHHTRQGALVAVSPTIHAFPLGWWEEGYARRPAIYVAQADLLINADERRREEAADHIFDPSLSPDTAVRTAAGMGVRALLIDERWSGFEAWREQLRRLPSSAVPFAVPGALIITVH